MRILHMSDTHGVHRRLRNLLEADILVHSGDFTMSGSEAETLDFLEWVCDLPYRHKVLVAGFATINYEKLWYLYIFNFENMKKMEFVFQRKIYERMLQWKQGEQDRRPC